MWVFLASTDLSGFCPGGSIEVTGGQVSQVPHAEAFIQVTTHGAPILPGTFRITNFAEVDPSANLTYRPHAAGDYLFGGPPESAATCGEIALAAFDDGGASGTYRVVLKDLDAGTLSLLSGSFDAAFCPATY
jgi:hypothetical protein